MMTLAERLTVLVRTRPILAVVGWRNECSKIESSRADLDEFESRLSLSPVRVLALGPNQ